MIKFENVHFKYRSFSASENTPFEEIARNYAVKNISFAVEEGQFVAVLGHNGSGKSTLAKLVNGLLIPEKGDVTVMGINTRETKRLHEIRKNVGMVFQNPDNQMIASIVEDDIAFGPENIGIDPDEISKRVDWALDAVGMKQYRHASAHRLSGGQKQRIAIAGVLAIKPKILVLDESTAMLDPVGRKEVLSVVKNLNREFKITVLLITHFMEEAVDADKIIVLNDGELVLEGSPTEVFGNYDYLKGIGLSVPFAAEVARRLAENGVNIDADGVLTTPQLFEKIRAILEAGKA
jgi:energy-coupling factor transport system ATP-binding protein